MSKKSFILSTTTLLLAAGAVLAVLYVLLCHEPDFYGRAAVAGPERARVSRDFEEIAFSLLNRIQNESEWQAKVTEEQVNSWFAEDFVNSNLQQLLPAGISEPRIMFEPGRVRVGLRYGEGDLSTVISATAKVWLPKREPNVVALELLELRAGALPLAVKVLQDVLTDSGRRSNIDVQWYRSPDGNPVALLRFQADRREPTVQLQELNIQYGSIFVRGRSIDPEARGALGPTPGSKTAAR